MTTARKTFWEKFYQNPHGQISDIYEKRGEVHKLIGKYDKALFDFDRILNISKILKDEKKRADSIFQIGNVYLNKGDFNNAEKYFNKCLDISDKMGNKQTTARCYKQLGKVNQFKEKYNETENLYNKALSIFEEINDISGKYSILEYISDNYLNIKKIKEAIKLLDELIKYYEKTNNKIKLIRLYQSYGKAILESGNNDKGMYYLGKTYSLSLEIGEKISTVYSLCNLGIAYYKNNDFIKAKDMFKECYDLSYKQDIMYMNAVSLLNLGDTCYKLEEKKLAKEYLDKVVAFDLNIEGIKNEAKRLIEEINSSMKGGENT